MNIRNSLSRIQGGRSGVLAALLGAALAVGSAPLAAEEGVSAPSSSKWRVRGRVIGIIPDDSSSNITLETAGGGRTGLNAGVGVDAAVMPEFDVTYMITPHIGIEAIASMANHDVSIDGEDPTLSAVTGLASVDNFDIFDVWVLPPTVTLQYHFRPDAKFRPYAGVGVNYTAFLWNDAKDKLEAAVGPVDIDTSSSWGWAAQFGMDWDLKGNWFANIDVKYIDIDTTASLYPSRLGPGTALRVNVDVDPWVVGAGIGYRF
ncbi:MAG: OmpW/AlkL family protein [Gammaproteobacteria bacterium]